jgi:hypothetical protein
VAGYPITPEAGRVVALETAERSYDHAVEHLRKTHAIYVGKELAIHMTASVGRYWLEQDREALRPNGLAFAAPVAKLWPQSCLIFADGVMIHTDGDWHEARVGTVRSQMADGKQHKSSIARLCSLEDFGLDLWRKAHQMGYGAAPLSAFIADGSHWLWNLAQGRFNLAVQILDFWHLCEHVGNCAKEFFGEGTDLCKAWSLKVCGTLRAGLVDDALKEVEHLTARSKAKRQAKHELVTYMSNNRQRMDYPRYEELGLPIGSGEVEAQCKTLVQARCKQAGMRWSRSGAEDLLRVRCAVRDGSFDESFGNWPTNMAAWMVRQKRQTKKAA